MANRLPAYVEATLKEALSSAKLERCGVAPEHQAAMKLYLDTWVAERIQRVLEWSEGKADWSAIQHMKRYP